MFSICGQSCKNCQVKNRSIFQVFDGGCPEKFESQKMSFTFEKGETIFHNGDPSEYVYCICSGMVQLFRSSQMRDQSFAIVTDGAAIGYRDVLARVPYQHNARAMTRTVVCKIKREEFFTMMGKNPVFMSRVISELAGGWQESEKQTYNLGARKTVERLADFLINLKNGHPELSKEESVDFPYTRETVATLLGTTTESVIRALSDFKSRGYVDFVEGKLLLKNEPALMKIVLES